MPRTLIVGFGRAGRGLHWTVLDRLRRTEQGAALISGLPPVVHDADPGTTRLSDAGIHVVPRLADAAELLDPEDTVVHLCTPPAHRLGPLAELAGLGFRNILVEKPLVADVRELPAIDELRTRHGLRLMVVAHWLRSALTTRLTELVTHGGLGELKSIFVAQRKPRLSRTLSTQGHPTAFDVELPHSVGVVLSLAGDARTEGAELHDMHAGEIVVPEMGAARLLLTHESGTRTEIFSDLGSPIRERVIKLGFSGGSAVGHFPIGESDDYATLTVSDGSGDRRTVFRDDSLGRFLLHAYEAFATGAELESDFRLNARVAEVLAEAKTLARQGSGDAGTGSGPGSVPAAGAASGAETQAGSGTEQGAGPQPGQVQAPGTGAEAGSGILEETLPHAS